MLKSTDDMDHGKPLAVSGDCDVLVDACAFESFWPLGVWLLVERLLASTFVPATRANSSRSMATAGLFWVKPR